MSKVGDIEPSPLVGEGGAQAKLGRVRGRTGPSVMWTACAQMIGPRDPSSSHLASRRGPLLLPQGEKVRWAASLFAVLTMFLFAAPAFAAPSIWTTDPSSKITFTGAMNGSAFTGTFKRWNAQIAFDPKALAASKVSVAIDVGSASSGDADRDQAMPTDDWFAAGKYPKATFVTQGFKDLGGGHYQAIGALSLRGVTQPVVLPFTLAISGDTAHMNGAVALNRTAFGVGQGQWKSGDTVDTQVTVTVNLTAHRAK